MLLATLTGQLPGALPVAGGRPAVAGLDLPGRLLLFRALAVGAGVEPGRRLRGPLGRGWRRPHVTVLEASGRLQSS